MEILCSTGNFIGYRNGYDFHLLEEAEKVLSCKGIEVLLPFEGYNCFEVAEFIIKKNIFCPVVHADKRIGELLSTRTPKTSHKALSIFDKNCRFANCVRANAVVLHLWGGSYSDKSIKYNLNMYAELEQIAKRNNIKLMIENVPCIISDPLIYFEMLYERYKDVLFTYDTRFAAFHSMQFDYFYNKSILDRIHHIHVSDYCGGKKEWSKLNQIKNIGKGIVDFKRLFDVINAKVICDYITVEVPSYRDYQCDFTEIESNIQKIKKYVKGDMDA